MIDLRLQMFGTGSSGANKGGGGGSKSTSKAAVSSNVPGSGHGGGGGRRMDGGSGKREEEPQARTTQQKHADLRTKEPKKSSESSAPVKKIIPTEHYTIHSRRGELQQSSISGSDMAKAGYRYDQRDEVWRDKRGKEVKVRVAKRK